MFAFLYLVFQFSRMIGIILGRNKLFILFEFHCMPYDCVLNVFIRSIKSETRYLMVDIYSAVGTLRIGIQRILIGDCGYDDDKIQFP